MTLEVRALPLPDSSGTTESIWTDLLDQGAETSPFLTQEWFEACSVALRDRELQLLVVEEGGVPIGLIPLQRRVGAHRGLPIRYLSLIDCPDSPFADVIVAGPVEPVVRALVDHVLTRSDWDVLEMARLPAGSPTLKALESELSGRLLWRRAGNDLSPYLAIDGSWKTFYAATSQRFKKTARNTHNRLARLGTVVVEEHRALDPNDRLFQEVIDLTSRSWKADRGVAIATMPWMREFFAELSRAATRRGWLSLWLLRLDGEPIAMEYQLRSDGIVHALRADYDLRFSASSPGSVLNFEVARALFERGDVHEYRMGPGLNDYKMRWATACHETVRLQAYRPGLYPRLLHFAETTLVPVARRLRGLVA
jgi:CelD/BcsL family acetyltransferase involved in cellulose biosynthesis